MGDHIHVRLEADVDRHRLADAVGDAREGDAAMDLGAGDGVLDGDALRSLEYGADALDAVGGGRQASELFLKQAESGAPAADDPQRKGRVELATATARVVL